MSGVLLLSLLAAAPAPSGTVTFVTRGRVYIDRGRADGLEVGATVELLRKKKAVKLCQLDGVSAHDATCPDPSGLARPEARVRFPGLARPSASAAAATRTTTVGPAHAPLPTLDASAVSYAKVDGARAWGEARGEYRVRGGAEVSFSAHTMRLDDAAYDTAEVEAWASELPLGPLTASVHVRARARPTRVQATRFRPGAAAELYVLDAAVGTRPAEGAYTFAVGRVGGWRVLGLGILDGAVGGYRSADRTVELGAYAGLLPEAVRLMPSVDRPLGGAYWSVRHVLDEASFSHEGRVGVLAARDQPWLVDGELAARLDLGGRLLVAGAGRAAYVSGDGGGLRWVSATADAVAQLVPETLVLRAAFRERHDTALPELDADVPGGLGVGTWARQDSRHAYGEVEGQLELGLSWAVRGGLAQVLGDDGLTRGFVGPELGVPRLFGAVGGLTLGYQESLGWLGGRTIYAQSALHFGERWRVLAHVALALDRDSALGEYRGELGGYLHLGVALTSWLDLRVLGAAHATILAPDNGVLGPGLIGQAALTGTL